MMKHELALESYQLHHLSVELAGDVGFQYSEILANLSAMLTLSTAVSHHLCPISDSLRTELVAKQAGLDNLQHGIYHDIYHAETAKLFRNGRSQAVRLPVEYRFEGSEVYVRRDPATGDVILSRRPDSWEDFFELTNTLEVPKNFLTDRDDSPPQKRGLF